MSFTVWGTRITRRIARALLAAALILACCTLLQMQVQAAGEVEINIAELTRDSGDDGVPGVWWYTGGTIRRLELFSNSAEQRTFRICGDGTEKQLYIRPCEAAGSGGAFDGTIVLKNAEIKWGGSAALDFTNESTATLKLIGENRLESTYHAGININSGDLTIEPYDAAAPASLTVIAAESYANGIGTGEDVAQGISTFDKKPVVSIWGNCTVTAHGTQYGNALGAQELTVCGGATLVLNNLKDAARGLDPRTVKNLSNCTIGGGAAGKLAGSFADSGQKEVGERFALASGKTYYFDLSHQSIPGTQAGSLQWVPFVYAGTVDAYASGAGQQIWPASPTSLFVAKQAVTTGISWNALNAAGLIAGTGVNARDVSYQLRVPSGGDATDQLLNEWDQLLRKQNADVDSGEDSFWCQDAAQGNATVRGGNLPNGGSVAEQGASHAFRPVLAVNDDMLGLDALKTAVFSMGTNGSLGTGPALSEAAVVYTGALTLPAVTQENGFVYTGTVQALQTLGWWSDGQFYAAGTALSDLPNDVRFTAGYAYEPEPQSYNLTVAAGTGGSVLGTPSGSYTAGTAVDVTATADNGYRFTGWTVNGVTLASPTNATATFSMPSNSVTLTAKFEAAGTVVSTEKYTVTYQADDATSGNIPATATHEKNSIVTVEGQGNLKRTGYHFTGWKNSVDGKAYKEGQTFTLTADTTFTAQWRKVKTLYPDIPQTGDTSNVLPYILLLCGSLLGLGTSLFYLKRSKREQ